MNRREFLVESVPALTALAATASSFAEEAAPAANTAQDLQPITLVKPETDGGKSVLAALQERRTNRNIKGDKLPPQVLSNLLWAAYGVNRQSGPFGQAGRTAASARRWQRRVYPH